MSLEHYQKMQELKRAPLADRKAAQAEFAEAMRDHPDLVAERLSWLIDGSYGQSAYDAAQRELARGKAANKIASLNCLIAAYEWSCPADMAIKAWKTLTSGQKARLDRELSRVVFGEEKDRRLAAAVTIHGRCSGSRCFEHEIDSRIPSCKSKGRKIP